MNDLTAWEAAKTIMRPRAHRNFVLPNYTPSGWWESDVFELTSAGYFVEYEIKLNISDFKRDATKRKSGGWWWNPVRGGLEKREGGPTKHEILAQRSPAGPSRFYFVTPAGMVATEPRENLDPLAVLPEWAGLIELEPGRRAWRERVVRRAPQLHRQKVPQALVDHAKSVVYYRMHTCFQRSSP